MIEIDVAREFIQTFGAILGICAMCVLWALKWIGRL